MLIIGIVVGYFMNPVISGGQAAPETAAAPEPTAEETAPEPTAEEAAPDVAVAPGTAAVPAPEAAQDLPAPEGDVPTEADMQELMTFLTEETRHFKGDPDAPVTMIEFSDFRCPFCGRYSSETAPQIDQQYVEEGLVRVGYVHAAYQGEPSMWAAEASECAAEQDAFWEYHDFLIDRLVSDNDRDFTRERLKGFAEDLDLDTEAFNACMESEQFASVVMNDTMTAQTLGIRGTPTFLINGQPLVGAQPLSAFEQVIEAEIAAASEDAAAPDEETE